MERNVSLSRQQASRRFCVLTFCALCLAAAMPGGAAEVPLVLVASVQSPLAELSSSEVRRLYLGIPLVYMGHEVTPLRNAVDPVIQEVFLQRVMFMSVQAYERQMAARIFRTGGNDQARYTALTQLVDALVREPWAVTYMSPEMAARLPGIKIITNL